MMLRIRHRCTQLLVSARVKKLQQRRYLTDQISVLGTGTLPVSLMIAMQEELKEEEFRRTSGVGEALRHCIRHNVLDHLESPEADAAHLQRVDTMIENLFSKIPLPVDPIKSALAPTEEELQERKENEMLKEAVREQYLRQNAAKIAEEERIKHAMRCYEAEGETVSSNPSLLRERQDHNDTIEIKRQIDEMKRQMERLEKLLESKSR